MGQQWPVAGPGALNETVNAWDLLKESPLFHYFHYSLVLCQTPGRERSLTHQQKSELKMN